MPAGQREPCVSASLDVYPITAGSPSGPMLKDVISVPPQKSYFVSQGNICCRTRLLQ